MINKLQKLYFNNRSLIKEKDFYIKKTWFLIGHVCEFKKTYDFKTLELFGNPIVVYKFKNGIKAFSNVCLHRNSIIKDKTSGNGKFFCPYHFWSYDDDGKLKNVPLKEKCFNDVKNLSKMSLKEWKINFCGNFVFLTSIENKISLKSFLGSEYSTLKHTSYKIKSFVSTSQWIWNSNWKLCVENSIDEYHAIFVHQTTFKHILNQKPKYKNTNNVMTMEMPLRENYVKKFKKFSNKFNDTYKHILIFPLSTIASTMEHSFYLQRYTPISTEKTLITSDIYLSNFSAKVSKSTLDYFSTISKKFNDTVFEEDQIICENNQRGMKSSNNQTIIGNYEKRIKYFRKKIQGILK